MKDISCALLVTDGEKILLVQPTGQNFWEPPKGIYDFEDDYNFSEAALRECKEETGIGFPYFSNDGEPYRFVGVFEYNKYKDLAITVMEVGENYFNELDMDSLDCTSTFNLNGVQTKEICGYNVASLRESLNVVIPQMARVLQEVYKLFFDIKFELPEKQKGYRGGGVG